LTSWFLRIILHPLQQGGKLKSLMHEKTVDGEAGMLEKLSVVKTNENSWLNISLLQTMVLNAC